MMLVLDHESKCKRIFQGSRESEDSKVDRFGKVRIRIWKHNTSYKRVLIG